MAASTDRQTYRALVAEVAERAKKILPQAVNGRLEAGVRLVLNGDVEPLEDGSIKVGSSDPTRWYHLVGTSCTCTDFTQGKAPEGWCKHRIAAGLAKRVSELVAALPAPAPAPPAAPLPEAPVSITLKATLHGHEVLVTLRGVDFASVKEQVEQASAWLQSQTPVQASSTGEGWCSLHNVQMKQNHKAGRSWWSHQTDQGWCRGR
jgi:hypothetical protein